MPQEQQVKDPESSAILFLWVLAAAAVGAVAWILSTRLHLSNSQIIEGCLYLSLAGYGIYDIIHYYTSRAKRLQNVWPPPKPHIDAATVDAQLNSAAAECSVLIGHETDGTPFCWNDETRSWQTIASGMSGSGKTTLIESILQQDIRRGVPVIFIDGKGERKLLDKILPAVEAAGRMKDFRLIDPTQPEVSSAFNPFWAPNGNPDEHVAFIFESFKVDGGDDFFDQHQRVYLENIARILHHSGKRFNFYDVLVAAYDEAILFQQIRIGHAAAKANPSVTRQQVLTLEMSIQNVLSTFQDKERVSKIQGLINHMMTYMSDSMALITGPYDDLLTIEDVLDEGLILYINLNINVNKQAVTSLGRILLQNLQLALGRRYADTGFGVQHPFVSVLLDEFAPFAYQNFSTILQTARGANVGFLFALQTYAQLDPIGFGLKDSLSTGPNNSFMLRMKDDKTATQFRKEGGEVKTDRLAVRVEKGGVLSGSGYEEQGSGTKSEAYEIAIRDEMLKRLPTGQMQALMTDKVKGLKHLHIHVRKPAEHFLMTAVNNLYPAMLTPMCTNEGLNLRFPVLDLEANRNDHARKGAKGTRGRAR
jgi:hypothetical protein